MLQDREMPKPLGGKKTRQKRKKKTLVSRMSGKTWEGQKGGHEA